MDSLNLSTTQGSRSLNQFELSYKITSIGLVKYLEATNDWVTKLGKKDTRCKKFYPTMKESKQFAIDFTNDILAEQPEGNMATKSILMAKKKVYEQPADSSVQKNLHG